MYIFCVCDVIKEILKPVHLRFINMHNKRTLNHLTRRPKKGDVSAQIHSHIDLNIRIWTQIIQDYADDISVYMKSTMCTNSSGPLQLPTIPVTGHSIHRFRKFPVPS